MSRVETRSACMLSTSGSGGGGGRGGGGGLLVIKENHTIHCTGVSVHGSAIRKQYHRNIYHLEPQLGA